MPIQVDTVSGAHVVTGNTFDVKHILKRHGARWDAFRAGWRFESIEAARAAAEEASAQLIVLEELAALQ